MLFRPQTMNKGSHLPLEKLPFTKEQIDVRCKLLQSSNVSSNSSPSCSLAQKDNYLNATLLSVHSSHPWIIDSGATDHMTGFAKLFLSYNPYAGNQKIKIADGSLSAIAEKGSIVISPSITLHDVLHIPNLSCNLLSVSKLTRSFFLISL